MPSRISISTDKLVARSIADPQKALLKQIQKRGFKNLSQTELLKVFGKDGSGVFGRDLPRQKKEHVRLNSQKLYVKDKAEMRLFNASLVHPGNNAITFEDSDSLVLVWLYGLKIGTDYSIRIRLKGFPNGIPEPLPKEPGVFKIFIDGNEFTLKPTFQEQVVPLSLLSVQATNSGIWISAEEMRAWQFYELTATETDL